LHPAAQFRSSHRPRHESGIVAVVDDAQYPLAGWGENLFVGQEIEANYYETDLPAFDPIGATNYPKLWTRGSRCSCYQSEIIVTKRGSAYAQTSRPISGTAIQTSMQSAAWSTHRNAISIRGFPDCIQ